MSASRTLLLSGVATLATSIAACDTEGGHRCGPTEALVTAVIDGDTIEIDTGDRIRYLLVDTPELSSSECFSQEASDANTDLVLGETVRLEYDTECQDQYGRLLAYVSVGDREINSLLVLRGYACVLYISPNGSDRREEFQLLEATAEAQSRGMWGECLEVPCNN